VAMQVDSVASEEKIGSEKVIGIECKPCFYAVPPTYSISLTTALTVLVS